MRLYFATDEWIDLGLIRAAELGFDVEGAEIVRDQIRPQDLEQE